MACAPLSSVRLLAALLIVVSCVACQQQQQQQQQQQSESSASYPDSDNVEELLSQAMRAATEPLLRRLLDRLERLESQLNVLDTRLDSQDHKLDGLATRLDNQSSDRDGLTTRLDNQGYKLDGLATLMATRLDGLTTRLDNQGGKCDGLATRLDNQDLKLDGLAIKLSRQESTFEETRNELATNLLGNDIKLNEILTTVSEQNVELKELVTSHTSQDTKLDGLVLGLSSQDTRLNGLVSNLSSQDTKLDGLFSDISSQDSKLDRIASKLSRQNTNLDRLVSDLSIQDAKLDRLDSDLSSQGTKLDGLVSNLSSQDAKLDGIASNLSSQASKLCGLMTQLDQVSANTDNTTSTPLPRDCSDLSVGVSSGVYMLQPGLDFSQPPVAAYCDMDTDGGGWTVIQRRADIQPRQDFYLGWAEYRNGFGDLEKEFWWGLQNTWKVTAVQDRQYQLRIDLQDFDDERRYALYRTFGVSSESDGYRLLAKNYTGDAGDDMDYHNGHMFTTKDRDQDLSGDNCADTRKGGWWYNSCTNANLNGPYLSGESPGEDGVSWYSWRGRHYSLKAVEMKISPV